MVHREASRLQNLGKASEVLNQLNHQHGRDGHRNAERTAVVRIVRKMAAIIMDMATPSRKPRARSSMAEVNAVSLVPPRW